MKKVLLSLFAIMMAMSAFAEMKTVKFDMSNPEACGWTGGVNKPIADTGLKIGDIAINVTADASSNLQKIRFAKSGDATVLKFGTNCAISIETAEGNIRSIKIDGTNLGAEDVTVDAGNWAAGAWSGVAPKIVLTQAGAAADIKSIEVTYQVADKEEEHVMGETESYVAVTATEVPDLDADGVQKVDEAGNALTKWEYAFNNDFANPVLTTDACTVNFGTESLKVSAVAGTTAKTVEKDGVTEWNEMKFELKNHLNDNNSGLHLGIALGTGNPVFGYEIEEVWKDGVSTGYRQCFNKQNPDYDHAAAYAAQQAGETYSIPQYLEEKYYYWKPGCGKMPAQGLYYKFTAEKDGQLKAFVWINKGNRNIYLVDEETKEPVSFKAEGYMNNQTTEDGKKKFLTTLDVEALNDPAKPYVICGTQAGGQVFWGNVIYNMKKGQSVWLFQESSQVGFHGFDFTPFVEDGIQEMTVDTTAKSKYSYNLAGQRVNASSKGIIIKDGKKFINK